MWEILIRELRIQLILFCNLIQVQFRALNHTQTTFKLMSVDTGVLFNVNPWTILAWSYNHHVYSTQKAQTFVYLARTIQWADKIVHKLHKIKSTHMWASLLRSLHTGSSAAVATEQSLTAAARPPHNMCTAAGLNSWSNFGVHANPQPN